ncbi:hypothetical protein J9317_03180 [Metabacillus sp. KIGAM252]|uniref:Colicin D immunity protein domain-containing protein n=1 Tax=Metabacillus flavus TaxID=2823519 RepID=A0ABS5LAM5_9BACI|nr:hypothetical protein [Metabacillus flavus]MBS2967777.1 hypothetical protein [Metabacillus flavus]
MSDLFDLAAEFLELLIDFFPTKKNREFKRKFKELKKMNWFKHKYGSGFITLNDSFRDYILTLDMKLIHVDDDYIIKTKTELDQLLKRERL